MNYPPQQTSTSSQYDDRNPPPRSPRRSSRSPAPRARSPRDRGYDSGYRGRSPSPRSRDVNYQSYQGESRRYDDRDRRDYGYRGRGGYGGYGRRRSPPRRREVLRGSENDRQFSTCLYVGNLPYGYRDSDVASMFERYGRIRSIHIPVDRFTSRNKGFAFVTFEERREAEEAKDRMENFPVEGRRLRLDWDIGPERKDEIKGYRRNDGQQGNEPLNGGDRGYERPPPSNYDNSYGNSGQQQQQQQQPYNGSSLARDVSPTTGRDRRPGYEDYGNSRRSPSPGLRR
ncbi:hypothetical protein HK098_002841 [Nowakowskiella sp. JEL0407]|nr:hypothetical protein HK098_002841 [Nowakowskiella sp. JEL0407]